jgi:hypothetical protein
MGNTEKTFFTCGVKGCGHIQDVPNPEDIYKYGVSKGHMVSHYRWEHADLIGKKVYPYKNSGDPSYWRYEYKPIPDKIGPSLAYQGEVTSWAEICEIEGPA